MATERQGRREREREQTVKMTGWGSSDEREARAARLSSPCAKQSKEREQLTRRPSGCAEERERERERGKENEKEKEKENENEREST